MNKFLDAEVSRCRRGIYSARERTTAGSRPRAVQNTPSDPIAFYCGTHVPDQQPDRPMCCRVVAGRDRWAVEPGAPRGGAVCNGDKSGGIACVGRSSTACWSAIEMYWSRSPSRWFNGPTQHDRVVAAARGILSRGQPAGRADLVGASSKSERLDIRFMPRVGRDAGSSGRPRDAPAMSSSRPNPNNSADSQGDSYLRRPIALRTPGCVGVGGRARGGGGMPSVVRQ